MTVVDPSIPLDALLRQALVGAVGSECDPQVHRSTRSDLQADVALQLAKRMGVKGDEIAARIVAAIPPNDLIEHATIAPAGFINFQLRSAWLADALGRAAAGDRLGVPVTESPQRIVIDYSSPNIAKELHVGHLRSTVIGDALARVLDWLGHTVIRQNHIGDWGTPFGKLIEHLLEIGADPLDRAPAMGELSVEYRVASKKYKDDPEFAERARRRVVELQAGDARTVARWRVLVDRSIEYMEDVYRRLGITLERADLRSESFFNDRLAPLASELEANGTARISDGALCVFLDGFTNRENAPLPLIVRNRDGGFGYGITDLAAIRYRLDELRANRLIYVVGAAQAVHLDMVFTTARKLGWLAAPAHAEHVGFGLVLGSDRKKLASRQGDPPRLAELIENAIATAEAEIVKLEAKRQAEADAGGREHTPLPDDVRREVARMAGIGSIKYADLAAYRIKDYIFDLNRMVKFIGNTAGYAQYVYARVRSVFRFAPEGAMPGPVQIALPEERALALQLLGFGAAVRSVGVTLQPHHLVGYVFELATVFTAFYEKCPIVRSDVSPEVRGSRLALADMTARTIERGLALLGIEVPDRM